MLTIGSLFAGIGGLELGLEQAGLGPVLWHAEQEPFCRRILAHHWPHAHAYEAVEEVDHEAPYVDIICGGFPCQDVSNAGTRTGLAGERSGLWAEFLRVIRCLRPRYVVIENVSALLARGIDTVLGDLAESGYNATWDCIPAAAVGAPHRRDRIFLVARRVSDALGNGLRDESERRPGGAQAADRRHAEPVDMGAQLAFTGGERPQGQQQGGAAARTAVGGDAGMGDADGPRCEGSRRVAAAGSGQGGKPLADGDLRGCESIGVTGREGERRQLGERRVVVDGCDLPQWPPGPDDMLAWSEVPVAAQPAFCQLAHGLPADMDWVRTRARRKALTALGNAVVPEVARIIGRAIVIAEGGE